MGLEVSNHSTSLYDNAGRVNSIHDSRSLNISLNSNPRHQKLTFIGSYFLL